MRSLLVLLLTLSLFAEEKTTSHTDYTATVGTGEISYIAYTKPGENRPLTFVFNGGPGSSSVWLHMGTFGPRRILTTEEGQAITPPYQIVDNAESILDLTDLVFIDPNGTGLSKMADEEKQREIYSIWGDVRAVGDFIRDYLTANKRWNSPKYLAGESYGAMRAAGLADYLQNDHHIFLNGVIFISAAFSYQPFFFEIDNPTAYFLFLPTYATTAWHHGYFRPEATLKEVADEAREFALKTYAASLLCHRCYEQEPIWQQVAEMTGLPYSLVKRYHGRVSDILFTEELLADQKKRIGRFDARTTGYAYYHQDPSDSLICGLFAGAFHDYLHQELDVPSSYQLLSLAVNEKWNYWDYNRWGYPNILPALRKALLVNPTLKLFVGCGYFDLATPFAAAEYAMDHLDVPDVSVQIEYYEGGHMYYLNPAERIKFKQDLVRFYTGRDSKIGRCQGGAPILSQALPAPKQINLKSLSMQAGLKSGGCPTQAQGSPQNASFCGERASAEPIFESRAVYQRNP